MAEGGRKPYDVFLTMLPKLTAALGKEPTFTNVTDFLLADGLITKQQLESIKSKPNLSDKQRGSEVAHCLLDKIKNHDDPAKCLLQICDIFEDEDDVGSEVLKKHGATMRSKIKETPEASRSDPIKAQPTVPVFSGTTASSRFRSVSDRLENAISSCLTRVVGKLYAQGLISLDLKDEMINSHDIPSKKASKLVSELQRTLNNDKHPETFLNDVCTVLKEVGEKPITDIANELVPTGATVSSNGSSGSTTSTTTHAVSTDNGKRSLGLTINDLDKVIVSLERAGFDKGLWDKLGRKLGLYPNTLGVISKDKGDVDSCFTECLSKWLKRADDVDDAGKPTWNSLADALGKVKDCKDQADYIRGLAQEGDAGALGKNNAKKRKIDTTKESSKDGGAQLNADDEDSDEPDAQASSLVPEESQVGRGTNRTTPEHHAATDSTDGPGPDLSLPVVSDIKGGGKVNYNDEVVYKMNTTPRGYCLIINMKKDRPKGNEKDVDKLKTLFKDSLQFAFKVYNDLKAEDIDNLMEIVKRDSHKLLCCFVMFILAHGGTEDRSAYFKTYDEEHYKVSRIKKKIESISYLNDKPKLLFIQSCRGGLLDTEVEVLDWDKIKTPSKIPRGSDFLTSFATIEDYPACRGEHGSRFIQCLCKVFTAYHDKCDVVTMMTMVTKEVAAIARDVGLEDGSTVCVRQNPETTFTFRKFLFFGKPPQWVNAHLSKK